MVLFARLGPADSATWNASQTVKERNYYSLFYVTRPPLQVRGDFSCVASQSAKATDKASTGSKGDAGVRPGNSDLGRRTNTPGSPMTNPKQPLQNTLSK